MKKVEGIVNWCVRMKSEDYQRLKRIAAFQKLPLVTLVRKVILDWADEQEEDMNRQLAYKQRHATNA